MLRWTSTTRGRLLSLTAALVAGPSAVTPSDPTDHGNFEGEDEERGLDHRANGRWHHFWLDVEGVPDRETSPVAPLAREAVPDRKGDRQELSGQERGA